jgi:hypothetical protein
VVLHETGHAYDMARGLESMSPYFQAAYAPDAATFAGTPYFTSGGNPRGHLSEAYAEMFAEFYGRTPPDASVHPNLWLYWFAH